MKFRTINLVVLISFLLTLSVGVYAQEDDSNDFSLMEYKSQKVHNFKDLLTTRANIMIVTSTTCSSCISELKAMDWIRAKYRGDMSVTAVFIDRGSESRVYNYIDYYKFDLDRFLMDPGGTISHRFKAPTVPTMIMFDKKGNERFRREGFKDGDESMIMSQAEEIMYGKRESTGRRAQSPAPPPDSAQPPAANRTTGCASTG